MNRVFVTLVITSLFWPSALWIAAQPVGDAAHALGLTLGSLQREVTPSLKLREVEPPVALRPEDPAWQVEGEQSAESSTGDQDVESRAVATGHKTAPSKRSSLSTKHSRVWSAQVPAPPIPKKGLRVSASTVLRLANARAVPGGAFQPATGRQPSGMRLSGVSAMGVGLRDGDLLSHVAGSPATSRSAIVSQVLAARAKHAQAISATFWRDGEPWRLIVEMPYLRRSRTASVSPSSEQAGTAHSPPLGTN